MQRPAHCSPDDIAAPVLTKRQRQIVALIAEGLSNQAIADRLGLSRRTISRHIAMILWRLGLASHLDIAAWAVEQEWHAHSCPPATA